MSNSRSDDRETTSDRWRLIEALYHEVLVRPLHEREAALMAACPDDAAVRAEVQSLLDQPESAAGFLATPAMEVAARLVSPANSTPTVEPGTRLGPYEIERLLGEGGMGRVFRARDTRLGRAVAIKMCHEGLSARFEREARSIAALNHPHVCTLYDIGPNYLVMELVQGETLASILGKGPLPLDRALREAVQIADALAAAHEHGIVHRDLKPANVMITPAGVKVLDFGLAKRAARVVGHGETAVDGGTEAGRIVGTAAYMSPEQARGEAVDQRTDIWAFGCVLYEMITGRRVFGAATTAETLARILEGHPDLDALPAATPAAIRRLLRRCLEPVPRERLQHIGDARADIVDAQRGEQVWGPHSAAAYAEPPRRTMVWTVAVIAVAVAAAGLAWFAVRQSVSEATVSPAIRFDVPRVERPPLGVDSRSIALSLDGSRLAYTTRSSLRIRTMGGDETPMPVIGREPFFSPDGEWLAFFTDAGLQKMPVGGGALMPIMTGPGFGTERPFGGTWGPGGTIVISIGGSLMRSTAEASTMTPVAKPDTSKGEVRYAWPEFLPDGRSILFTIVTAGGAADAQIAVIDIATGRQKTLLQGGHAARYVPTGHLLYASRGRLQAVRFDADRLEILGAPAAVERVALLETTGGFNADFSVSATGTLAFVPPAPPLLRTMAWVDRNGREEPISALPMPYVYPRISPDGSRVALDIVGTNRDIHVWDFARRIMTRITEGPTEDLMPAWADNTRIFFASDRLGGTYRIFSIAADGAGSAKQEFVGPVNYMPLFATGNTLLAFASGGGTRGGDVVAITFGQETRVRTLLGREGNEGNAQVSPDGRWIAYESVESGEPPEVYVRPYPEVDRRRVQISLGGGVMPRWGRIGSNELFYWTPTGSLKVVSVSFTPDFKAGIARDVPLGDDFVRAPGASWVYDVSPRDGRLLVLKLASATSAVPPIKVAVNWREELKRLLPPD